MSNGVASPRHCCRVTVFRLLYLDHAGAIVHACEYDARDDVEALIVAEEKRGLPAMQLWTGDRKIKHWGTFPPAE